MTSAGPPLVDDPGEPLDDVEPGSPLDDPLEAPPAPLDDPPDVDDPELENPLELPPPPPAAPPWLACSPASAVSSMATVRPPQPTANTIANNEMRKPSFIVGPRERSRHTVFTPRAERRARCVRRAAVRIRTPRESWRQAVPQ